MTANLSFTANGAARFAYKGDNGDPWHRLGTDVRGLASPTDMLSLAHCDYTVEKFQIFTQLPDGTFVPADGKYLLGHDELTLGDSGFVTSRTHYNASSVTDVYDVEQNEKAVDFALDVVAAMGHMGELDTIGSLHDGRTFFVCIQLEPLRIGGDEVRRYIVVTNSHGDGPLQVFMSTVRVVCSNTLAMAKGQAIDGIITIRHTASKDDRKLAAQAVMAQRHAVDVEFAAQAERMLEIPVGAMTARQIVAQVFGDRPQGDDKERAQGNWDTRLGKIRSIFNNERNAPRVGPNGWAMYNAVAEYLDWERPRIKPLNRMQQAIDPKSSATALKAKTAERVLALA